MTAICSLTLPISRTMVPRSRVSLLDSMMPFSIRVLNPLEEIVTAYVDGATFVNRKTPPESVTAVRLAPALVRELHRYACHCCISHGPLRFPAWNS